MRKHAIEFVKWIQVNCVEADYDKYFLIDDDVQENTYTVEKLYNLFIVDKKPQP